MRRSASIANDHSGPSSRATFERGINFVGHRCWPLCNRNEVWAYMFQVRKSSPLACTWKKDFFVGAGSTVWLQRSGSRRIRVWMGNGSSTPHLIVLTRPQVSWEDLHASPSPTYPPKMQTVRSSLHPLRRLLFLGIPIIITYSLATIHRSRHVPMSHCWPRHFWIPGLNIAQHTDTLVWWNTKPRSRYGVTIHETIF